MSIDQLQDPAQDALQNAIRQSRALNDNERYELLISEQEGLADADLNTICFSVAGGRRRKKWKLHCKLHGPVGGQVAIGSLIIIINYVCMCGGSG